MCSRVQSPNFSKKIKFLIGFDLQFDSVFVVGIQIRIFDNLFHQVALGHVTLAVVWGGDELEQADRADAVVPGGHRVPPVVLSQQLKSQKVLGYFVRSSKLLIN